MRVKVNMNYFLKNGKLHKSPVPLTCPTVREGERLYGFIPKGYELCPYCFRVEKPIEQVHERE